VNHTAHLAGTIDLAINAPAGMTAVRFYLAHAQLRELTDVYVKQTGTEPAWSTARTPAGFRLDAHTLRAEANGPPGDLTATKHVVIAVAAGLWPGRDGTAAHCPGSL
jgi:hypothetical protein